MVTDVGLEFEINWEGLPCKGNSAAGATRGSLRLLVGGEAEWPYSFAEKGVSWTLIELLEFLADAWPNLALEDGTPFSTLPAAAPGLRQQGSSRWALMPADRQHEERALLEAFLETHDLARALQGITLPSVVLIKEGLSCWVCTENQSVRFEHKEVLDALRRLGESILRRIQEQVDPRSEAARKRWERRNRLSPEERLSIATGLDSGLVRRLFLEGDAGVESPGAHESMNELVAAARMAGTLPEHAIQTIVEAVRQAPKVCTVGLDEVSERAEAVLKEGVNLAPFEQGYRVATWLRDELGLTRTRMYPDQLLRGWGVAIGAIEVDVAEVDAFAAWGDAHGPVVFVNERGWHNRSASGRRATLAHELGHVLMDRHDALPLAEVLGGSVAIGVEARANAFAAEFLLPRQIAVRAFEESTKPPSAVLASLVSRYQVSREVVAWQVRNSREAPSRESLDYLRQFVSEPGRF